MSVCKTCGGAGSVEYDARVAREFEELCERYLDKPKPDDPAELVVWKAVHAAVWGRVNRKVDEVKRPGAHWYRAFKNWLHNGTGEPTRDELREMVRAAVAGLVREELGRHCLTEAFAKVARDQFRFLQHEVIRAVAAELAKGYKVKVEEAGK